MPFRDNRIKDKKYHTVGTNQKSKIKIVERPQSIPVTDKYMTAHFTSTMQMRLQRLYILEPHLTEHSVTLVSKLTSAM